MTKQRDLILQLVRAGDSHKTAEEVYREARAVMPGIVMATVYNNLNALAAAGMITRIRVADGPDRFDRTVRPHYHLICDGCGALRDIPDCAIRDQLERLCGTPIRSLDLNAHYLCESCRAASDAGNLPNQ